MLYVANRIKPFIDVLLNPTDFIKKSRDEQAEESKPSQKCKIIHQRIETIRPNKWIRTGSITVVELKKKCYRIWLTRGDIKTSVKSKIMPLPIYQREKFGLHNFS